MNVFFRPLPAVEICTACDQVANDFFDYLYQQILAGKISKGFARSPIKVHVATYKTPQGEARAVVTKFAAIKNDPLNAFEPPCPEVASAFKVEQADAAKIGYDEKSWGYVDRSDLMATHFHRRGLTAHVDQINTWLGAVSANQLHEACKAGDMARATKLVREYGVDVNAKNDHGSRTPIAYVRTAEHFDQMIAMGADPTYIDSFRDDITYFYEKDVKGFPPSEVGLKNYASGFIDRVYELTGRRRHHYADPLASLFGATVSSNNPKYIAGYRKAEQIFKTLSPENFSFGAHGQHNGDALDQLIRLLGQRP